MSRVEREENPRPKVGENEKLIRAAGGEAGGFECSRVSDLVMTQEGARRETGTGKI